MKKFITFIALLALASGAYVSLAADTNQARTWVMPPTSGNFYAIEKFVVTDSNACNVVDTSFEIALNPWMGFDGKYPDAIALYGVFTEIGTNAASVGDCLAIVIDVSPVVLTKASSSWVPITGTAGSMTYANRTGKTDTLNTGIADGGSGAVVYTFTASQLAACFPYARIRWGSADAAVGATDSMNVSWYAIYSRSKGQ